MAERLGTRPVLRYPETILIDGNGEEIELFEDRMDMRHPRPHERRFTPIATSDRVTGAWD